MKHTKVEFLADRTNDRDYATGNVAFVCLSPSVVVCDIK